MLDACAEDVVARGTASGLEAFDLLEALVREGKVGGYADLAAAGQISRPRMSQLLRLLELAPAIQEQLLFLPRIICGRDRIREHALRKITRIVDWEGQMKAFRDLMTSAERG